MQAGAAGCVGFPGVWPWRRVVPNPLARCLWYGVAALALCWALLLPLKVQAQPAGDGWVAAATCAAGVASSPPAPLHPPSALVMYTVVGWESGVFESYGVSAVEAVGSLLCPGFRWDEAAGTEVPEAAVIWLRWLPVEGPDEPPEPSAFSWSDPAAVLQLLLWGAVPLIGFWGYSMGARE
jgi:hypothetical protein